MDIGVAVAGPDCSELLIRNEELTPDDEIQVVSADELPHKKVVAKVVGSNGCPEKLGSIEEIYLDGEPDEPKYRKYQIHFADENDAVFGFAVVSSKANVEIQKGVANLTAENLPSPLLFRVCSGNESYHMSVWEGKPLIGKRVWYTYMSLSYGTVHTCKPADLR